MQLQDSHPSDRELVLAADGELPPRQVEQLREHLARCWECRVRAEELETAIAEFVHFHRRRLDPMLPPVSGRRALLKAELEHLSPSRTESQGWLHRFRQRPWIPVAAAALVLALASLTIPRGWQRRPESGLYAGFLPVSFPAATLTPGVARVATRQQVCGTTQEKNRDVPISLRRKVFELYGITGADPKAYEVDYLITPALGGVDDIGNLWPQSYSATIWNARVKDALEDRLHDMVCRGDIDVATAQREISTDWIAAYKKYFHTDRPVN